MFALQAHPVVDRAQCAGRTVRRTGEVDVVTRFVGRVVGRACGLIKAPLVWGAGREISGERTARRLLAVSRREDERSEYVRTVTQPRWLIAVLAGVAAGGLVLASCSTSVSSSRPKSTSRHSSPPPAASSKNASSRASGANRAGASGGAGGTLGQQSAAASGTSSCKATIAAELNDLVSRPSAFVALGSQPGKPVSPAVGEPSAYALGKAMGEAAGALGSFGLAGVCGIVTTSYLARVITLDVSFGAFGIQPPGGPPSSSGAGSSTPQGPSSLAQAAARLEHIVARLTAAQRAQFVDGLLHGQKQPGSLPETVTSVTVQTVSSTANEVKMNVTTNLSEQGGTGNSSEQVTAWKIGGRWYASSFH